MSNYQARRRAIRAERAAERCVELCERMRRECRDHERRHYERTAEEFRLQHALMEQQIKALTEDAITSARMALLRPPIFLTNASDVPR